MWSTVTNTNVGPGASQSTRPDFIPTISGVLPRALLSVYKVDVFENYLQPGRYSTANLSALNSAISSNVGLSLALIPVSSPASAVISKTDPATGASVGASSTLGPVFTERAETIGKRKFFVGFSHQNYHFTEINGQKLNGLTVLYPGGDPSAGGGRTNPATFNMGVDVRLSQDLAFLTYGLTDRVDVSVGLPVVHAGVSATAYNGVLYAGEANGNAPFNCWCQNTFAPGTFRLTEPLIGSSSATKSGFGDLLVRTKGAVLERPNAVVAIGADLRFATGDADNYLGTGTTTVKPFAAVSLYGKPTASGFVFSPHFNVGWQFSGKSPLGGQLSGSSQTATLSNGDKMTYSGAPLIASKDYLPDVFAWAVGTELGLGKRNTVVADILGNQIGWINGAQGVKQGSAPGFSPLGSFAPTNAVGMVGSGKGSFSQYSGSFGYKTRVAGNLVATFNVLVRFDDNGLTARAVPLFGLGYTFTTGH